MIGTRAGEDRLRHGFAWGFVLLLFLGFMGIYRAFYIILYYYMISPYLFREFRGLNKIDGTQYSIIFLSGAIETYAAYAV